MCYCWFCLMVMMMKESESLCRFTITTIMWCCFMTMNIRTDVISAKSKAFADVLYSWNCARESRGGCVCIWINWPAIGAIATITCYISNSLIVQEAINRHSTTVLVGLHDRPQCHYGYHFGSPCRFCNRWPCRFYRLRRWCGLRRGRGLLSNEKGRTILL